MKVGESLFIPNNTVITTERGSLLAENDFNKFFTINGFEYAPKKESNAKSLFVKSELFPTIGIGEDTNILVGRLESSNDRIYIKNNFYSEKELKEGDYLYIPKINYDMTESFNRTMLWLYAKYIVGGYYCLEKQTNIPTIIINLNRFSKKEAVKLKKYDNVFYDLEKKMIIIQNEEIIQEFKDYKSTLNLKVYGVNENLSNFFIHSMLIENSGEIVCRYKSMAYDIFMFAYSKCNEVYKITELKRKTKKIYSIKKANNDEYIKIKDQLYSRITKILEGREVKGISVENDEKNIFCISFLIMK